MHQDFSEAATSHIGHEAARINDYVRNVHQDFSEAATSHIGHEAARCEEGAKREEAAEEIQKLQHDMNMMKKRVARSYPREERHTWGSLEDYLPLEGSEPPTNPSCSGLPPPPGLPVDEVDGDSEPFSLVFHHVGAQFPKGQGRSEIIPSQLAETPHT